MKDCKYPNCAECEKTDCDMEGNDIHQLLARRRYRLNPELYRQKQRDYRERVRVNLPHCDDCKNCILVKKEKQDGYRRLCIKELRLIEQKVSNSPHWCALRKQKSKSEVQNVH